MRGEDAKAVGVLERARLATYRKSVELLFKSGQPADLRTTLVDNSSILKVRQARAPAGRCAGAERSRPDRGSGPPTGEGAAMRPLSLAGVGSASRPSAVFTNCAGDS
jgi:hypothetical protein